MTESSQYVVVGAGLAGAAVAWRLAAAGHEVVVLERSRPANADGSSHGSARIFRYAYPEALYTRLAVASRDLWSELESASGTALITPTGALDSGEIRDPRGLAKVLESIGIDHELLTAGEAASRFPMFAGETDVLWHPGAGVIDAERSVLAMLDLAQRHGARLRTHWELAGVERTRTGFLLHGPDGADLEADQLIVCAGGWLPDVLGMLPLPAAMVRAMPLLTVRQEQAFHFPYLAAHAETVWPSFIHKSSEMRAYGLPGGRDADFGGLKVAEFLGGRSIGSARAHDHRIDPANRARLTDFARTHLPGVDPVPYAETTCLFTSTPTEDFVLDCREGITLVSPCSGHGGKFAPLIGELTAGLVTGTGTVPDVFRLADAPTLDRTA